MQLRFLLAHKGKEVKEIIDIMHISKPTIYEYRTHILNKTKTSNEIKLLFWVLENKLVTIEDVMKK